MAKGQVLSDQNRLDRMGANAIAVEHHLGFWSPVLVSLVTGEALDVVDRFATAGVAAGFFQELVSGGPSRHLAVKVKGAGQ